MHRTTGMQHGEERRCRTLAGVTHREHRDPGLPADRGLPRGRRLPGQYAQPRPLDGDPRGPGGPHGRRGNLTIQSRAGDIFADSEDGNQGPMQNIVVQDLPGSGPWTATTRLTWNPTGNFQNAGMKVYDSDEGWIKFGMVWNAGRKFEFYKELNDGPTNLTRRRRCRRRSRARSCSGWSPTARTSRRSTADGEQWTPMGTAQTNLNGFADPKVGMYATATGQPSIPAVFDWFTLDSAGDPNDEFGGDSLDLCRWTEIVRHDPAGYEVTGGELVCRPPTATSSAPDPTTTPTSSCSRLPRERGRRPRGCVSRRTRTTSRPA